MKKRLITFGCSYTDEKYVKLCLKDKNMRKYLIDNNGKYAEPFPFWPQWLASKLDMQLFNYAQCGFGNDGIYSVFIDEITNQKDIGLAVIMWSAFLRMSFELEKRSPLYKGKLEWFKMNIAAGEKNSHIRKRQIEVIDVLDKYNLISLSSLLKKSLRYFYSVQNICENMNIPYIQIMGMPPCKIEMENEFCKNIIKSSLFDEFDKKTFIGWPIFPQLDGFSCGSKFYDIDPNREKYFINYKNVHPNVRGQKFISDLIYKELNNNVNISVT